MLKCVFNNLCDVEEPLCLEQMPETHFYLFHISTSYITGKLHAFFNMLETPPIIQSIIACELRANPVPPVADSFIAYIHTTFMKQIFHISQWEWKSHIQHHCKLDDLWTSFKIVKEYRIGHVTEVNFQNAVWQGGLFWQSHQTHGTNQQGCSTRKGN